MFDLPLIDVPEMTWDFRREIGLLGFPCNAILRRRDQGPFNAAGAASRVGRQRPFEFGDRPVVLPRWATRLKAWEQRVRTM
jgi:hypothetical protein